MAFPQLTGWCMVGLPLSSLSLSLFNTGAEGGGRQRILSATTTTAAARLRRERLPRERTACGRREEEDGGRTFNGRTDGLQDTHTHTHRQTNKQTDRQTHPSKETLKEMRYDALESTFRPIRCRNHPISANWMREEAQNAKTIYFFTHKHAFDWVGLFLATTLTIAGRKQPKINENALQHSCRFAAY